MSVKKISELWNSVSNLVLSQYKYSSKLLDLLKKNVNSYQSIEDCSSEILDFLDLYQANGVWLDLIGKFRNIKREGNESDSSYRERISDSLKIDYAGTARFVIENAIKLSGDESPIFFDEAPATFFVYTPNGRQIVRRSVKRIAPAGVLGLPGAAIQLANGSYLGTYANELLLAVADDAN